MPTPSPLLQFLRSHGLALGLELLFNLLLPYLVYVAMRADYGDVGALMGSAAPPVLWALVELLRHRRLDALSLFVLASIVLSLLAFLGGGSVQVLQLREKLVTVLVGLVFLGSALVGRPLLHELARAALQRRSAAEAQRFEALGAHSLMRRGMTVMTLVWGGGLLADAAISVALVCSLPIAEYLVVGALVSYGTLGALGLWTVWYGRYLRRQGALPSAAGQ